MIAFIRGKLFSVGQDYVIVDVNGVGYRVFCPLITLNRLPQRGDELLLFTHHHLREDASQLYGFLHEEELDFFRQLIEVSGVGPKVGLGILSAGSVERIREAIVTEDIAALTKLPGIGKKTAQRLILELKDKLVKKGMADVIPLPVPDKEDGRGDAVSDALQALLVLGYQTTEATQALAKGRAALGEGADVDRLIKEALKHLVRY